MPDNWFDEENNHCTLLAIIEDDGQRIIAYKFKNDAHRWEYRIKRESHIVFPDSKMKDM
ncbi:MULTISPECIES: hypothetical protein [Klebsiella]|uniref:hypothetical protein n=1 Tax=Klebsiella TaxID=570 RepID=UPI000E2B9CCA|nr:MULTISPECIES: hypothetical protein [Klebsiella]HDT6594735.1 hypothetical protein [Raoultella ornithinolytica]MCB8438280.1 hypothetical protein [Klebsiella pneumoniae]MCB8467900.1 hypothetical protein [Klebsiella pneumoniae]MEA4559958.1 hypothetical protein [Klebsiella pneumoniae]MEB1798524.1 hypothetical protein [Klebsiella pneumoniae]